MVFTMDGVLRRKEQQGHTQQLMPGLLVTHLHLFVAALTENHRLAKSQGHRAIDLIVVGYAKSKTWHWHLVGASSYLVIWGGHPRM